MPAEGESMERHEALSEIGGVLQTISGIEGAFLGGSLANQSADDLSDIDLGIATQNSAEALGAVHASFPLLVAGLGVPLVCLDREWQHCKMVAALYGRSRFPPLGLEIDCVFSQLRHVSEQMPYSDFKIIFDRGGNLESALSKLDRRRPRREVERQLERQMTWCVFSLHDGVKACRRGDVFQGRSLIEEVRELIFFAAAVRSGAYIYGAKRAHEYLSAGEKRLVASSYAQCDEDTIKKLMVLYIQLLSDLRAEYHIAEGVEHLRRAVQQLL